MMLLPSFDAVDVLRGDVWGLPFCLKRDVEKMEAKKEPN